MSNCSPLAVSIAQCVMDQFNRLGGRGKPQHHEWTVLAGIVRELWSEHERTEEAVKAPLPGLQCISLATGTRCLGRSLYSQEGKVIHDSHAEVLSRRGLMKWLMETAKVQREDYKKAALSEKLHFFVSELPCGSASIVPLEEEALSASRNPRRLEEEPGERGAKKPRLATGTDHNRIGAKLVAGLKEPTDEHGVPVHSEAQKWRMRFKPCRSDSREESRSLSYSCSDKISWWQAEGGWQGGMLCDVVGEVFMETIVIAENLGEEGKSHVTKALVGRGGEGKGRRTLVEFVPPSLFPMRRSKERTSSSGFSIVWVKNPREQTEGGRDFYEVLVGNRGDKGQKSRKARNVNNVSLLAKRSFLEVFRDGGPEHSRENYRNVKTFDASGKPKEYVLKKRKFKQNIFEEWKSKSNFFNEKVIAVDVDDFEVPTSEKT